VLRPQYLLSLIIVLAVGLAQPAASQSNSLCPEPTGSTAPPITYVYEDLETGEEVADKFDSAILGYLNANGSSENLDTALAAAMPPDSLPEITADVIEADLTGDGIQDVLANVNIFYGASYNRLLAVYACDSGQYQQISQLVGGGFFDSFVDTPPTSIVSVIDMNADGQPEVVVREGTVIQKYFETAVIYQWNGTGLLPVAGIGSLGSFRDVRVENADDDPATLELVLDDAWGYGQAAAMAMIEISRIRPIRAVYTSDGELICKHFTDEPPTLFEALHSAETYRACGDLDTALRYYQQIIDDPALLTWDLAFAWGQATPTAESYVAQVERAYLTAFAHYRIAQIYLSRGDIEAAQAVAEQVQATYPPGTHGHKFAASTAALLNWYQGTGQMESGCEQAFEAGHMEMSDPGIDPVQAHIDPENGWGFYYYSGFHYSSDPTSIYHVPPEIADMIQISICLE
jgi:tetratricopeptide (TPR) repeat protein